MSNIFKYKGKSLTINRFPKSTNRSLRSWSAADELLLTHIQEKKIKVDSTVIYNDRFGFLSTVLDRNKPLKVLDYKSQEWSIRFNLEENEFEINNELLISPLQNYPKEINLGLVKIPKSLDLLQLQLQQISNQIDAEGSVICSFMTKNFSKRIIEIAEIYFDKIEQTKAVKKARLMILSSPKKGVKKELINSVELNKETSLNQYFGVFSSNHIDYASQFLIDNLKIDSSAMMGLDLASGNGVLAYSIRQQNKDLELHLVDDMALAIESSKMNLTDENTYFHHNNSLEEFQNNFFDFVVCNPPFHFEYETNIEVSLTLFKNVKRCLRKGGEFFIVANQHLNYKTHLSKMFPIVEIVNENDKFVIYKCVKS